MISARHTLAKQTGCIDQQHPGMFEAGRISSSGEVFSASTNWREHLERMRVGDTQKLILTSYMKSIESLLAAEEELTDKILEIKHEEIELLAEHTRYWGS